MEIRISSERVGDETVMCVISPATLHVEYTRLEYRTSGRNNGSDDFVAWKRMKERDLFYYLLFMSCQDKHQCCTDRVATVFTVIRDLQLPHSVAAY